jgi:hypothetical protein
MKRAWRASAMLLEKTKDIWREMPEKGEKNRIM